MEIQSTNEIAQLIGQFGFPMFVAIWYMFKQSQDTKAMTEAFSKLTTAIEMLITAQKGEEK